MGVHLTKSGYEKMQQRLRYLREEARAEVAEEIKVARGFGDLSENAEYDAARKKQGEIENEINELESKLNTATIISATEVEFCYVVNGVDGEKKAYTIVGSSEADLSRDMISGESPIGKALMECEVNQQKTVTLPNGKKTVVKVLSKN